MSSSFRKFAERELELIGSRVDDPEEGPNKWAAENVLELIDVFEKQGHSGASAPIILSIFNKVARWEPVTPLTGADEEWTEVGSAKCKPKWQNKRCPHVFKESNGRAYDSEGRIFREPSGACFTNRDSRVYIEFPYTPKSVYVDAPASK